MEVSAKISNNLKKSNISEIIEVPQWNPKKFFSMFLKKYGSFTAIIFGSRMMGKSNMLKHLLISKEGGKLVDKMDMIIVFSKTIINGYYAKFLKTKLLFDTYKPDVIDAMKKLHAERKAQGKKFHWLVIFDDCVTGMKYQESLTDNFYNGRHYGMSIIFLTQKASECSTNWRNNTTLYIVLKSGSRKEKKYISENIIADAIEPQLDISVKEAQLYRIATHLQNTLTEDYNAIVTTPFCKRKIKQYKAPLHR